MSEDKKPLFIEDCVLLLLRVWRRQSRLACSRYCVGIEGAVGAPGYANSMRSCECAKKSDYVLTCVGLAQRRVARRDIDEVVNCVIARVIAGQVVLRTAPLHGGMQRLDLRKLRFADAFACELANASSLLASSNMSCISASLNCSVVAPRFGEISMRLSAASTLSAWRSGVREMPTTSQSVRLFSVTPGASCPSTMNSRR